MNNVLIVVTAYNESKHIANVLKKIINENFNQILVIDDGSTDNTSNIAKQFNVMVIKHIINRGQGAGIKTAIEIAKKMKNIDIVVFFDGDDQHIASDIKKVIKPIIDNDYDVVIGSRFLNKNEKIPLIRKIYNKIANILTIGFRKINITDTQSGFKAIKASCLDKIDLRSNGYAWCSEFILEIINKKLKYTEVPIDVIYHEEWKTKGQNLIKGIKTLYQLMLQKFTK